MRAKRLNEDNYINNDQVIKEVAIDFAEWLWLTGIEYQRGGKYLVITNSGSKKLYTIEQLYNIFLERKQEL
jgi:hypothetical protein